VSCCAAIAIKNFNITYGSKTDLSSRNSAAVAPQKKTRRNSNTERAGRYLPALMVLIALIALMALMALTALTALPHAVYR
jgi:hypothetical protein